MIIYYAIRNTQNPELFWSNDDGWVDCGFDLFNQFEKEYLDLPIDGEWIEYN